MAQNEHPVRHFDLPNFAFTDGTSLPLARLAYLDINSTVPKVALIPTCFKGTLHSTLNFSSGALHNHRIIVIALFGNGESSSPPTPPHSPPLSTTATACAPSMRCSPIWVLMS
ncbi:homoserine O-acetyltransferase [Colletotrichum tofieldiae]|nr:homoserine O-acetyltransferase [Colletotrichum tofieldiae]